MTTAQMAAIERQARLYVQPQLNGGAADAAVRAILAWEWSNPDSSPESRTAAWARILRHSS